MVFEENCICGARLRIETSYTTENNNFIAHRYKEFLAAHEVCRRNHSLKNTEKETGEKNEN